MLNKDLKLRAVSSFYFVYENINFVHVNYLSWSDQSMIFKKFILYNSATYLPVKIL